MDYFTFFNLSPSVFIDRSKLDESYQNIQKLLHPDVQKNDLLNLNAAIVLSSKAAKAYDTLKNPLSCVRYLLKLKDITFDIDSSQVTDPKVLNDILDIQEQMIDDSFDKTLVLLGLTKNLESVAKEIENAFLNGDITRLQEKVIHFFYYFRLKERLENSLDDLFL